MEFYLVDFENVQPKDVGALVPGGNGIKVFLGASQSKVSLELVHALQPFGSDAQYIQISGSGPNAVDFHIAFYIGQLAASHPGATFAIVSKDTGFDPLIKHLATLGIACRRIVTFAGTAAVPVAAVGRPAAKAVPAVAKKAVATKAKPTKSAVAVAAPARKAATSKAVPPAKASVAEVVDLLKGTKTRPLKLKSLQSAVQSWFKPALDAKALAAVIQGLIDARKIAVDGTKVTYTLE